jgi:hypothetical protein
MTPAFRRSTDDPDAAVVACTLAGRRVSDAVEIVQADDGRTAVVLLDVRAARDTEALREQLASVAHASLVAEEPMHVLVGKLRKVVCAAVAASVGVVAFRVSILDARVELLNAGMPPVACILPDGQLLEFPSLSADVGPRVDKAHPYELIPLTLGSTWIACSDGATLGSLEDAADLWSALGLPESATDLGAATPQQLSARLEATLGPTPLSEDATLVVVPTHQRPRSASGII